MTTVNFFTAPGASNKRKRELSTVAERAPKQLRRADVPENPILKTDLFSLTLEDFKDCQQTDTIIRVQDGVAVFLRKAGTQNAEAVAKRAWEKYKHRNPHALPKWKSLKKVMFPRPRDGKMYKTDCVSFLDLLRIVQALPNKALKKFKKENFETLVRMVSGSVDAVDAAAVRNGEVSAAQRQVVLGELKQSQRAEEADRDNREFELSLKEREMRLEVMMGEHKLKVAAHGLQMRKETLEWCKDAGEVVANIFGNDEHLKCAFKDAVMREFNVGAPESSLSEVIEVSSVLRDAGYPVVTNGKLSAIGKATAKAFRATYPGTPIPTTMKYVNGAMREVKAYRTEHKPLVLAAGRKVLGHPTGRRITS